MFVIKAMGIPLKSPPCFSLWVTHALLGNIRLIMDTF